MTELMEGQVSMFDLDTESGKMSVVPYPQASPEEKTSELSWKSWQGLSKKKSQFLDLRKESGTKPESSSAMDGRLLGGCQTANIGGFLNVEEGLHSLLTSEDTMHLALFLSRANTTEAPCEEIPSHLSDILEENPDPKYELSAKACLGILIRSSRRRKILPPRLEEALVQKVVEETEYGKKGIADTVEILREMWCEIGEEDLKEWVKRTFDPVQPEEVLLSEMCESIEDSEDPNEQIVVERDCEENNGEDGMCKLWRNGEAGDTPQRQEPSEQLTEQLNLLMQKLPYENAQTPVIMYCLRIACEGEGIMSETLPTAAEEDCVGVDVYNIALTGNKTCSLTAEGYTSTGTCPKVMTSYSECYSIDQGGGKSSCSVTVGKAPTLTCTHGGEPAIAYSIQGSVIGRADHNGPQGDGVNEDVSFTLNTIDRHAVVYGISPYHSNCMKSDNPYSGIYEAETSRTLDALNCGYPGCNQGGMAVVQPVGYEMQAFGKYKDSGIASALKARDYKDATDFVVAGVDCRNATEIPGQNITLQSSCCHNLNSGNVVRVKHIVRRLTPLECERLQGFPDGWTDIGEWVDTKGKKHKEADSPRYKALGNSIALPPWKWVLKRLCACYERDATMASLFDGIGGFPLIWEQINGKGSCLWASEIEEFPIAVTKARFGE